MQTRRSVTMGLHEAVRQRRRSGHGVTCLLGAPSKELFLALSAFKLFRKWASFRSESQFVPLDLFGSLTLRESGLPREPFRQHIQNDLVALWDIAFR